MQHLTRDQKLTRKNKEIYLALELESRASKEKFSSSMSIEFFWEIDHMELKRLQILIFNKSVDQLTLAESATIAAPCTASFCN